MKKGCFISLITVITILVMAGIYFYKTNKGFFQDFSRDTIIKMTTKEFSDKIKKLDYTPYKDSLMTVLKKEATLLKDKNFEKAMSQFGFVADKIKEAIHDGVVDSTEFAQIKSLVKEHERSAKDRN
ncbi:MAG: hypothetical protein A2499_12145 [Stygiobacter sp. RIFOXYC12_FULL_38_8]|nr:MAG: hypothetical protein FD122_1841 [Stygiobacter sp.]KAF0212272.1 MAG: hypothetical protein FD178_3246 [Ignavibacteria bacterium]OGV05974.1 MAG: hypothetical protein A2299_07075 [Stygiobacter sp. RIFOXYB2_FULL_37_11]OGV15428.1 MAG: hypothetical protein A2237_03000 [Stygiobacter sp. RIFOXYA2_FULL_38_8]OGV16964.1 MAG: hypothetical protein A2440_06440 [Stygiobacter sp. RIFOXYC2_FULL_38_25]OGV22696.1 MAG: hypothetical protein A2499_12145 [Stygiobacter sp. RIFOXYC12_FULL_38_8]OGV82687.1 MAG: 